MGKRSDLIHAFRRWNDREVSRGRGRNITLWKMRMTNPELHMLLCELLALPRVNPSQDDLNFLHGQRMRKYRAEVRRLAAKRRALRTAIEDAVAILDGSSSSDSKD